MEHKKAAEIKVLEDRPLINAIFMSFKTIQYKTIFIIAGTLTLVMSIALVYSFLFTAPQKQAELQQFTVPLPVDRNGGILIDFTLIGRLKEQGFIKNEWAFKIALGKTEVQPGAYKISKSMNAWQIANALKTPYMKWVIIPEGWRKEQTAELLAQTFNWEPKAKNIWVNNLTAMKFDYVEGVYFPDTYLIPVDESPSQIAERMRRRFDEQFAPFAKEAMDQNIKWTTAVKLASIVQREAGSKSDMPLIAGILWNRLLADMKLEVDATVQYVRDSKLAYENDPCEDPNSAQRQNDVCYKANLLQPTVAYTGIKDWWKPITPEDIKQLDSLYNTYKYKGLPPHPIGNPGIDAIKAVLNPTETDCLYYLHDNSRQIHCAKTYEEHISNINQYLK